MRRRQLAIFTMSFLDCITAGFGAVVLLFMVMSAQTGIKQMRQTDDLSAESTKLDEEVLEGYRNLVVLRNTLKKTDIEKTVAAGKIDRVIDELQRARQELAHDTGDSMAHREHVNKLKSDLLAMQEGVRRLEAGANKAAEPEGDKLRSFKGTGNRQYINGIKLSGQHVLILVDMSASMLDETLVNVLRMRNLPDVQRMLAPKWQRAVSIVDWLTTQIPQKGHFQIYAFNTQTHAVVDGSAGQWLTAGDARVLNAAVNALRRTVPRDGTSLINAFTVARALSPLPDQIVLITDGLPTQGATPPALRKVVDAEQRTKLFDQSLSALPPKVPVTTILLPMEGDLPAPWRFWRLARASGGTFMMPSRDWP